MKTTQLGFHGNGLETPSSARLLTYLFVACACLGLSGCGDDGVTSTCDPVPEFDVREEPVTTTTQGDTEQVEYADPELSEWHEAAVKEGCATEIGAGVRRTAASASSGTSKTTKQPSANKQTPAAYP